MFTFKIYFLPVVASFCLLSSTLSAQNGVVYGVLEDGGLDEPLAFANVGITTLSFGTVTDINGAYRLTNVPVGTHTLQFSYLGYETQTKEITIAAGQELEVNMSLSEDGVTLEEIVVKGQAVGQRAAINQQINSNTIVNVVSREKLQELPDQNAAEAVGRLAGVSVYRNGGEGQQVAIRGISPRFNSITINGERLASTDEQTRSVDLSMISPDMLAGIELFKAITPDMDGDAVGGTVNFAVKKADEGLNANIRFLQGYNGLSNRLAGIMRTNAFVSQRLLDNKFGVIATANFQRADRSSESLNSDYEYLGVTAEGDPIQQLSNLVLLDQQETRDRLGGSFTLDYTFNAKNTILLNANYGQTNRDELRYRRRYRLSNNAQEFDIRQRDRSIKLFSTSINGDHKFGNFTFKWKGNYGRSDQETPFSLTGRFQELAATTGQPSSNDLTQVPSFFKNNLQNTIFYNSVFQPVDVQEERYSTQADLQYDFKAGKWLNGKIKTGFKYRQVERERDVTSFRIRPYLDSENPGADDPENFVLKPNSTRILFANFLGDYTNEDFLDGEYDLLPGTADLRAKFTTPTGNIDYDAYNEIFGTNYQEGDAIPYLGHVDINKVRSFYEAYREDYVRDLEQDRQDYFGSDRVTAYYAMTELNITDKFMLLGGVRVEETEQEYTAVITGNIEEGEEELLSNKEFVTEGRTYRDVLPMFHARYKPFDFMDVRAAVTKTLARPNFFNIVPWELINNSEQEIQRGNANLLQTNAWNYDLFLSFYNDFGLFTLGGFYKELYNLDYVGNYAILDQDSPFQGYLVFEPLNADRPSKVRGIEFDLQANLRPLNGWVNGLVFGANLTIARSETFYPFFEVNQISNPVYDPDSEEYDPRFDPGSSDFDPFAEFPPFTILKTETIERVGSVVGQANLIGNLTLGYEKKGFSGRVSVNYQSDALSPGRPDVGRTSSGVGKIPEEDFFDQEFVRMDVSMKQKLDEQGRWTVLVNLNNLLNTPERIFYGTGRLPRQAQFYGMTADLGIIYKLRK
ncbi:MAG: TonB-dependent receptor [Bacteroidota bacterium]